jgi:hypothetical protein
MAMRLGYAVNNAILKVAPVFLGIRALTYDRSNNYWLEMSWLQLPYYDRKQCEVDCCPIYAKDKE